MTRTMTWTDSAGASTILDGSTGVLLMADPIGLDVAPPTNTIDDYLVGDGAALIGRRRTARSIALGIYVEHTTRVQTAIAQIASMFQGPGQLQWADEVNTRALRQVIYDGGIDGSGIRNFKQGAMVVSLLALDPWWYGAAQSQALSTATATAFSAAVAFSAAIPFDGGNSASVVVAGDGEAYPVITVTGPATTVTVGSGLTAWTNATALASTDVLVVDTRPGSRGPRLNGGAINWALLSDASRLFTLQAGVNSIVTGVTGGSGATSIVMQWEPRYLTP